MSIKNTKSVSINKHDAIEEITKRFFTLLAESEIKNKGDKTYIYIPSAFGKTECIAQMFGRCMRPHLKKTQYVITSLPMLSEGADMCLVDEAHNIKGVQVKFRISPEKENKASFEEHIDYIKSNSINSGRQYDIKKKDSKFYSTVAFLKKQFPSNDIYKATGWRNIMESKASYADHINEAKKYKNASEYSRASKDLRFYSNSQTIKKVWSNFAKDAGWSK